MKVTKRCPFTNELNTMDIPKLTPELLERINNRTECIQNVAPMLNADEREFLLSGITPEQWNKMFYIPEEALDAPQCQDLHLAEEVDHVDSSVFSGDALLNPNTRAWFRNYLKAWLQHCDELDIVDDENKEYDPEMEID
jgi:hypothetical protein